MAAGPAITFHNLDVAGTQIPVRQVSGALNPKLPPSAGSIDPKYRNAFDALKTIPLSWVGITHTTLHRLYFLPCLLIDRGDVYRTYPNDIRYSKAELERHFRAAGLDPDVWLVLIDHPDGDGVAHGAVIRRLAAHEALEKSAVSSEVVREETSIGWAIWEDGPGKYQLRFASGRNSNKFDGMYYRKGQSALAAASSASQPPPPPSSAAELKYSPDHVRTRLSREAPKNWRIWMCDVIARELNVHIDTAGKNKQLYPFSVSVAAAGR